MTSPEDEIKDLREKNNELVQKVQYWKMTAAQRENEKLELMKEINELRLKLSRLRSGGAAQARKLDAELQRASEETLNHLVLASGVVARTMELTKSYMRDRQQLDAASPRWSHISGTPNTERVHRVPPMMGGQSILQPVVSLSRTILNTSNPRSASRSPNQSQRNITERAVPMHMLQDVYIPLTRIDATDLPGQNVESDPEMNNMDDSNEDLVLEDSNERSLEESQNITEEFEESSRRLDAVTEDIEEEDEEMETPPSRRRSENPLEGPSWLLDRPGSSKSVVPRARTNLEPDSTTELEDSSEPRAATSRPDDAEKEPAPLAFTPTVRRRKRTASPPDAAYSPRLQRRPSNSGRVLKVLIAKMRLEGDGEASQPKRPSLDQRKEYSRPSHSRDILPQVSLSRGSHSRDVLPQASSRASHSRESLPSGSLPRASQVQASPARMSRELSKDSPAKKPLRFDAPSPNGSTDARVIVSEVIQTEPQIFGAGDARDVHNHSSPRDSHVHHDNHSSTRDSHVHHDSRGHSAMSRDSDDGGERSSEEGRTRRPRKAITYKEKPLNSHSAMSRDSEDSGERSSEEGRTRRPRKAITYEEKPLIRKMRR